MISIVLYGRNDNYGYNLHKRAALSLNCMAEVLTAGSDEILYVDYNTPDDYPTFPEAICDTLTDRAKRLLRVLRVRSAVHDSRFAERTHLKALEPVSRNVAIRRSNPANRWILSTNTDMIFVPRHGNSLSDLIADLPDGFYCTPRFEIPETLWESFDRLDPAGVIAETRALGQSAHLNEIVLGADTILYDGPGDFQLMRRSDLFAIQGFHEDMLLGWHLDSNISKRLCLIYNTVGDAAPHVFGYHCDHTRQITPAHAPRSVENSSSVYVDGVDRPDIPAQAESWGLSDVEVEELRLTATVNASYRKALTKAIAEPLKQPSKVVYRSESYGREAASPEHILPFLVDLFANARRNTRVTWVGPQDRVYDLFCSCWSSLGFSTDVTVWHEGAQAAISDADAFIVDFGVPSLLEGSAMEMVMEGFFKVVGAERDHITANGTPRRIIGVNAVHNRYESLMHQYVGCGRTPFSPRLRHGYLLRSAVKDGAAGSTAGSKEYKNAVECTSASVEDWSSGMLPGAAGTKQDGCIRAASGTGYIFYGPYGHLMPGAYTIEVTLSKTGRLPRNCRLHLDVALSQKIRKHKEILFKHDTLTVPMDIEITVREAADPIEVRLHTTGGGRVSLEKVIVRRRQQVNASHGN